MKGKIDISALACVIMGLIFILFPSVNNTSDSLSFASSVRDGEELFRHHHLLYNPLVYILTLTFGISDTISFMCCMNALFAVGCLFLMRSMLLSFTDSKITGILIIFLGSCFGFIRFATDAEAYIVPLFFALSGSCTLLLKRKIFFTSFLLAVACLFHQLYFFWWIGLYVLIFRFFFNDRLRYFLFYASAACIVPLVYIIVFYTTEHDCNNILEFIFHDYIKYDYVDISFKPVTLILTPISFFRTFVQVHGYFLPLLQKYVWLFIPVSFSVVLFIIACFNLKGFVRKKTDVTDFDNIFAQAHLIIFFLQFLFAAFSDGNAEFMYMLPFAGTLYLFINYRIRLKTFFYLTIALFLWNFSLAIYPSHFLQLGSEKSMAKYVSENDTEIYYLQNKVLVHNIMSYYYSDIKVQLYSMERKDDLDSLISVNGSVITNITGNKTTLSRAAFVFRADKKIEEKYKIEEKASISYDLGTLNIVKLSKKN